MRLLLDTHVAIWAMTDPDRIGADGRALIADRQSTVYVSIVSIWEIAVKRALRRKSALPMTSVEAVRFFEDVGYLLLDATVAHITATEVLPLLHTDRFDRLLVAQAITEPLRLLTHDAQVAAYGAAVMRV